MDMQKTLVLAGSLALFLASAKAHGRQLRLEREKAGYWEVAFGGKNPAWVEGLWRQERVLFWTLTGAAIAFALAYAVAARRYAWPMPLPDSGGGHPWWILPLWAGIWPMTFGFTITGLISVTRLAAALSGGTRPEASWLRAAWWGAAGWWSLVAVLAAALALAMVKHLPR
jgi:hypothetical protein